ncbi:PilZ domain-containing protein [Geobacter chapellei]|uniref:PilZ domain-containing protein n=2 Tax=Pelotalea chapellei TaxID=44671 RepID=A0ABS5UCB9_9BACT|nr:PilZ domain-containing protein [Pelotalea chapellei]
MSVQDMRRAPRLKAALPILFKKGTGVTRDYSTVGIYFLTDIDLSKATEVDFVLLFNHLDAGRQMHVNCRGTVIRIRPDDGRYGVAVQLDSHTFCV